MGKHNFKQVPPLRFAENLRILRKMQKWNQTQLAEKIGVDQRTISTWEIGRSEPSLTNIRSLCNLFRVSVDTLLFEWIYF